jgi:predicted GIY-YIG superfamily endonuclease
MKIKLVPRGTPEQLAALVQALRQSPLIENVDNDAIRKRADHHATGQCYIWITIPDNIEAKPLPIHTQTRRSRRSEQGKKRNTKVGYVYLLEVPDGNWKIGYTVNPKSRHKTFNVKLPFKVKPFEHIIQTPDMKKLERELHQHFATKRVAGEWFALDANDIAYIKKL